MGTSSKDSNLISPNFVGSLQLDLVPKFDRKGSRNEFVNMDGFKWKKTSTNHKAAYKCSAIQDEKACCAVKTIVKPLLPMFCQTKNLFSGTKNLFCQTKYLFFGAENQYIHQILTHHCSPLNSSTDFFFLQVC